ncbi:hypothetical protein V6259_12785 [Marinomonas sp. TI.3.20]|uniref:hypothetical protein n=1 Tax=Marinomonas sp. TI.3.20 TaxID=3121296 RepID=UPI00311DAB4B
MLPRIIKHVSFIAVVAGLAGCSTLFPVEKANVEQYSSIGSLIGGEFDTPQYVQFRDNKLYSWAPNNKTNLTFSKETVGSFCTHKGGVLQRIDDQNADDIVSNSIGTYSCSINGEVVWSVSITIHNPHFSNPYVRSVVVKEIDTKNYLLRRQSAAISDTISSISRNETRLRFEKLAIKRKRVGQKVCSLDNRMGVVMSNLDKDHLRIQSFGFTTNVEQGVFFSDAVATGVIVPAKKMLIANNDEWAGCSW